MGEIEGGRVEYFNRLTTGYLGQVCLGCIKELLCKGRLLAVVASFILIVRLCCTISMKQYYIKYIPRNNYSYSPNHHHPP